MCLMFVNSCIISCFLLLRSHFEFLCLQITGEPLIQRKDDTVDVLKSRLDSFHRQTTPVSCLFDINWILLQHLA